MKKLMVIGIVFSCIVLMYLYPHTMLNPGELVEAHQELKDQCLACHDPFFGISNDKCISCHKLDDIGKSKISSSVENGTSGKMLFHKNLAAEKCTSCHTEHKGKKPGFSLSSFHHELLSAAMINNCNSCHSQRSDSLHKQLTTDCKTCHTTTGWKSSVTFNHDMIQGDGKKNCISCHYKPEDAFHNQLQDNCDKCHGTGFWKPSTFDHSVYFQLDNNHNANCTTCHTGNNFTAFTCYGCHEHSERKITEEHNEHGIYNFSNCTACHRSGNEHDIRMNENSDRQLNQNEVNKVKNYIKTRETDKKIEHKEKKEDDND